MGPADGGLFPAPEPVITVEAERGTPGARRRARQAMAIAAGQHPLSAALRSPIQLHPDARRDGQRGDDGSPRCGGCRFRVLTRPHDTTFPKCHAHPVQRTNVIDGQAWPYTEYPRSSSGPGTDVAAWWPACTDYQEATP